MLGALEMFSSAHPAVQGAMPAVIAIAEGIGSISFLQCPSFHQVHVADAGKADLADHVLLDVNLFRSSILGRGPRHEVVRTFRRLEWVCPQAESFAIWIRQDWLIFLERSELSGIQSNVESKIFGNSCESFLSRWNKGFCSCSPHSAT